MTHEELKQNMLDEIKRITARGVGARTTEVEDIWRKASGLQKPKSGYNDGSKEAEDYFNKFPPSRDLPAKIVRELAAEGKIRWFKGGGYCWMVPKSYEAYIGIKGDYVNDPFDLW